MTILIAFSLISFAESQKSNYDHKCVGRTGEWWLGVRVHIKDTLRDVSYLLKTKSEPRKRTARASSLRKSIMVSKRSANKVSLPCIVSHCIAPHHSNVHPSPHPQPHPPPPPHPPIAPFGHAKPQFHIQPSKLRLGHPTSSIGCRGGDGFNWNCGHCIPVHDVSDNRVEGGWMSE